MKPDHAFEETSLPQLLAMLALIILSFIFGMKAFAYHDVMQVAVDEHIVATINGGS